MAKKSFSKDIDLLMKQHTLSGSIITETKKETPQGKNDLWGDLAESPQPLRMVSLLGKHE